MVENDSNVIAHEGLLRNGQKACVPSETWQEQWVPGSTESPISDKWAR